MMVQEINKENIDQWIFELLEGNLNLEQSDRLLSEINKSQDFQAEYDYWREVYFKDEPLPESADLERKIIKNNLWENKWFQITITSTVVGVLVYFITANSFKKDHSSMTGVNSSQIEMNSKPSTILASPINESEVLNNAVVNSEKKNLSVGTNAKMGKQNVSDPLDIDKENQHNLNLTIKPDTLICTTSKEIKKADSMVVAVKRENKEITSIDKPEEKKDLAAAGNAKAKSKKQKSKTQINPADKVVKVNPNF